MKLLIAKIILGIVGSSLFLAILALFYFMWKQPGGYIFLTFMILACSGTWALDTFVADQMKKKRRR